MGEEKRKRFSHVLQKEKKKGDKHPIMMVIYTTRMGKVDVGGVVFVDIGMKYEQKENRREKVVILNSKKRNLV